MIKRNSILVLAFMLIFSTLAKADEGMWFLAFLNKNYQEMKSMGLKLTPEDIYSVNKTSLKDAIVALDHGSCTGEIISDKGLLLTNHHCGYGEIQAHSTVEHDYLRDGFWANSYAEELPNPGKVVSFLIRMEDVSDKVLKNVNDGMSEKMRDEVINTAIKEIEGQAIEGTNYEAEVLSMFDGNAYYMFVYEIFKDIRLVGAPPSSIGKYGGDTDNWMWPRHTGDFSIFRIYCAPDGSPAEYSPDNVPFTPKRFLKINLKGVQDNQFAMIMGYPGTTNRYLTSWEVDEVMKRQNTIRFNVRDEKLNVYRKYMDKDPKVKIQYAAKYAQCANYWKYSESQNVGLKNLKVVKRKKKFEKELTKWFKANITRNNKYGSIFDIISSVVKEHADLDVAVNYWFEAIYLGSEIEKFALNNFQQLGALTEDENNEEAKEELITNADEFFKDYNAILDEELFVKMLDMYFKNVNKDYYPTIYQTIKDEYNGSIAEFAKKLYSTSILTNKQRFINFVNNPSQDALANDLGIHYVVDLIQTYYSVLDQKDKIEKDYSKGRRLYVDAMMKMYAEKDPSHLYYPDANSSLRLTYGTVGGYNYKNETYKYYTTVDGYMAKEDPNNEEFYVSPRMKELYQKKDWGRYAYPDGSLRIDFLTNNDITGGNSGSPVMNGSGELIGIAFDGNQHGMSGDIAFEPDYQKTICADIKYVLWVIDKYGNAKRLIDEMSIIE